MALVDGVVKHKQGTIELAFRYDPENKPRQKYDPVLGKWGITRWERLSVEPLKSSDRLVSRIHFMPLTGRTHQLRLHAMHEQGLGFPIVGDPLYGIVDSASRLMLHADSLSFRHPHTKERMQFIVDPDF